MTHIVYQPIGNNPELESFEIDELSQRILLFLQINGSSALKSIRGPVGANDDEILTRYDTVLGPEAAELVKQHKTQQLLDGGERAYFELTEAGSAFVHQHAATMSAPSDIEDLAATVETLQIELEELQERVRELEAWIDEVGDIRERVEQIDSNSGSTGS